MHFSPRSGEEIFMHFFYAFRAKREKIFMHFFKHLCCFPQTLKKTLRQGDSSVPVLYSVTRNTRLLPPLFPADPTAPSMSTPCRLQHSVLSDVVTH